MTTVYKKGDNAPYVASIQRALNEIMKLNLLKDGDFGAKTENALKAWQQAHNFPVTGIHSGPGAVVLDEYIARRFFTKKDFSDAAAKLKVEVACIYAVQEVEAGGDGFASDGSLDLLFERHIFKKQFDVRLAKMTKAELDALVVKIGLKLLPGQQLVPAIQSHLEKTQSDIYNKTPGGYVGGVAENKRLQKAAFIHKEAALCSASWGMFQIMGFHYLTLGFKSAEQMVAFYQQSERNQLLSFCDFVLADSRLINALRAKDWASFAKAYNGPQYAKNQYDVKMSAAYTKHSAKV